MPIRNTRTTLTAASVPRSPDRFLLVPIRRLGVRYTAAMPDPEPVADARARRLYVGVFVCEALTIAALWAFERIFS